MPSARPGAPASRLRAARVMLGVAWAADKRNSVLAFGICAVQAVVSATFALLLKLLLDGIAEGNTPVAISAAAMIAVSIAAGSGLEYAGSRARMTVNERAHHLIERRLIETVGRTPTLEVHETPSHLTQLELLDSQGWEFGETLPSLVDLTNTGIRVVLTAAVLASVHWALLLLPIFGIPVLLLSPYTSRLHSLAAERSAEMGRRSGDLWDLATRREAAKELRLFRLGGEILNRFHTASQNVRRTFLRVQVIGRLVGLGAQIIFILGYFGAIIFIVNGAVRGQASAGEVILTAVVAGQVLGLLGHSAEVVQGTLRTLTVASRFVYLTDVATRARRDVGESTVSVPLRMLNGIEFDDVAYRYPHGKHDALHIESLRLPAGATIAIVGENGAGKTTLVKLLAGLYLPTKGRITVDEIDLSGFDPDQWRLRVSAAFQDHARWEFRVGETVGIGDLKTFDDQAVVTEAIGRAGGTDILKTLPLGLKTQLGQSWSGGIDLSEGQWQKLAIGRGMMRPSPLLLLLDEPTAALDADTEHRLFESWTDAAMQVRRATGAITVLVSHRFSTVRMADLVVVLDGGRVVEQGTHDELVGRNGLYAELYHLQANAYR